jgi:hypothetical protein
MFLYVFPCNFNFYYLRFYLQNSGFIPSFSRQSSKSLKALPCIDKHTLRLFPTTSTQTRRSMLSISSSYDDGQLLHVLGGILAGFTIYSSTATDYYPTRYCVLSALQVVDFKESPQPRSITCDYCLEVTCSILTGGSAHSRTFTILYADVVTTFTINLDDTLNMLLKRSNDHKDQPPLNTQIPKRPKSQAEQSSFDKNGSSDAPSSFFTLQREIRDERYRHVHGNLSAAFVHEKAQVRVTHQAHRGIVKDTYKQQLPWLRTSL